MNGEIRDLIIHQVGREAVGVCCHQNVSWSLNLERGHRIVEPESLGGKLREL